MIEILPFLFSCQHKESSLQQIMSKTEERFLYEGLISESEDVRISAFSAIFFGGFEKEKESFVPLGLQDSSQDVRWIVQQNLDITEENSNLHIRMSDKCLMGLWDSQWNEFFSESNYTTKGFFCEVWRFEYADTPDPSNIFFSSVLPSVKYPYRSLILVKRPIDAAFFEQAIANALDTSYPLILASWITLSDEGLSFVKREFSDPVLSIEHQDIDEQIDFVSLCSELSESYMFLYPKEKNANHNPKLQRIKKAFLYLEDKNTFCSLQSHAIQLRSKRLLHQVQEAETLQDLLYVLPAVEIFMTIAPQKEKEKYMEEITTYILPLLGDSESELRKQIIRILSHTHKKNIRYLQQMEEERLDVKIEIIKAIRMLSAMK